MPYRRKPEKGSFGGHFDELVKHFREHEPAKPTDRIEGGSSDGRNVHERLFERSWRKPSIER